MGVENNVDEMEIMFSEEVGLYIKLVYLEVFIKLMMGKFGMVMMKVKYWLFLVMV